MQLLQSRKHSVRVLLSKINAKCIIGLYELLESLRCSEREKRNTRLVKITSESAALLKCVHYVPEPPCKTLAALHSKVCDDLHGFFLWGARKVC